MVTPLDYERQNKYSFVISANFTDGTVALADVEVIVEDVNDNCPSFGTTEYTVYHTEPMVKDLLVAATSVLDTDTVGTLSYSLSGDSQFSIDQQGRIFTNKVVNDVVHKLDNKLYELTASVSDGRCSANTKIKVVATKILVDLYRFNEPYYRFEIGEEQTVEFTISSFNNKGGFPAKYYLIENTSLFAVNETTGQSLLIFVNKRIAL